VTDSTPTPIPAERARAWKVACFELRYGLEQAAAGLKAFGDEFRRAVDDELARLRAAREQAKRDEATATKAWDREYHQWLASRPKDGEPHD
jgi:DNA-binding FadR family transcriptional regulator